MHERIILHQPHTSPWAVVPYSELEPNPMRRTNTAIANLMIANSISAGITGTQLELYSSSSITEVSTELPHLALRLA